MKRLIESFDPAIKWCVLTVIFASPFSKSLSEIAITCAIIMWATRKIVRKDFSLVSTDLNIPLALFVAAAIPSLFISLYPALSVKALFTKLLKYVAFYFVIVESIDSPKKLKDIFLTAVLSMVVILIDGLIQYHLTYVDLLHDYPSFKFRAPIDGFFKGFPTASFPYPNDLATWILLALLPLGCAIIFGLKAVRARVFGAILAAGLFYLLFLTKARGAWVGFAAAIIYIAVTRRKTWLIILIVLMLAVPFLLKMEMAQYIFALGSVQDRGFMWSTGWAIFKEHPIIGNGINTFFSNFRDYRQDQYRGLKGSYAHNCYLQMAADCGIIGLGAFLWLMGTFFVSVSRSVDAIHEQLLRSVALGLSVAVLAFLIHAFFDTNLYSLNLVTLFWASIGIAEAVVIVGKKGVPA